MLQVYRRLFVMECFLDIFVYMFLHSNQKSYLQTDTSPAVAEKPQIENNAWNPRSLQHRIDGTQVYFDVSNTGVPLTRFIHSYKVLSSYCSYIIHLLV